MVLSDLLQGQKAKIQDLSSLNSIVKKRLTDLGFREGQEINVKTIMPFGGPCMIESFGQCIGIRKKEAKCIKVTVQ
ncbi:FeoA family protein [Bacillus kwashiorkori]|uniref:FeoA family protein n=1 Tax=Bacillus kwashiorkori TaxID=1522318 RepID=UPI0007827EBA|nr:FeoA family protein [Bacillus kwashiorkori]